MEKHLFTNWTLIYEGHSYPSACPNDVLSDLVAAGLLMDPYFDMNAEKARVFLTKPATYRAVFGLDKLPSSLRLHFEGIDTFADIYCNGVYLGSSKNMFLAYDFEALKAAKAGENILEVRLSPIYGHFDEKNHGEALFSSKRLQVRKAQCHFGWDWAPDLPGYGVYLPAYYFVDDAERLNDLYLLPHNDGEVEVEALLSGGPGSLVIQAGGMTYGPFAVKKGKNHCKFHVENPKLWFPNGYGKQTLYDYEASILFEDGKKDTAKSHFAFREVSIIEEKLDDGRRSFGFAVNGIKIFASGSNWVPLSNQTGTIKESDYSYLLKKAKEANYSMLRVWGGGIYEKDIFYDLCDKYGILVYQDFMYSCQKMPEYDTFLEDAKAEAEYQCLRLRKHPCLAILSGGNELYYKKEEEKNPLNALLCEISSRLIPSIRYIPSTPFGYEDDLWSSSSGDVHKSVFEKALAEHKVSSFENYLDENRSCFYTECTCLGSCSYGSLKEFLPEDKLWPLNKSYDYHFSYNPYALDPSETFAKKELEIAESFYGKVTSAEDFAKKSMLSQALILGKEITHVRADEEGHGHLNWMFNDNWGNGTWSVIDRYLKPKAAYYAQKRAFANVVISFVLTEGHRELVLVNDSQNNLNGNLTLRYGMLPRGIRNITAIPVSISSGEKKTFAYGNDFMADYCYAEFSSDSDIDVFDVCFFKALNEAFFSTSLDSRALEGRDNEIEYSIKANAYAHAVHFAFERRLDYSDEYFDLAEGTRKTIVIKGLQIDEIPKIRVLTFADCWDD